MPGSRRPRSVRSLSPSGDVAGGTLLLVLVGPPTDSVMLRCQVGVPSSPHTTVILSCGPFLPQWVARLMTK